MMNKYIRASIASAVLLACNSCINIRIPISRSDHHDPDFAAMTAVVFAKEAFIDLNQPEAYSFLSEEMQRSASLDQYINKIARMHPKAFPAEVTAEEYEKVQGKDAILIWLYGKKGDENFYYRLRMDGTIETGYKVAEMMRLVQPPSSLSRRALVGRRSTATL